MEIINDHNRTIGADNCTTASRREEYAHLAIISQYFGFG